MTERTTACPDFETIICLRCPLLQREGVKQTKACDKVRYTQYDMPKKCQQNLKELWELYNINKISNWKVLISQLHGARIY